MTAAPGERVITGAQLRATTRWVFVTADILARWTQAERVLVVLAGLLADDDGWIDAADLAQALTEPDTIECALGVLNSHGP